MNKRFKTADASDRIRRLLDIEEPNVDVSTGLLNFAMPHRSPAPGRSD
jgi:hypothetical protein